MSKLINQLKESDILSIDYKKLDKINIVKKIITNTKCRCISISNADFFDNFDWSWIPDCVKIIAFDIGKSQFDGDCDISSTKLEAIIFKTFHGVFKIIDMPKTLKLLVTNNNITEDKIRTDCEEHYGKHNQYEYFFNWCNSGKIYWHEDEDEDTDITRILDRFGIDKDFHDFIMVKFNDH